MIRDVQTFFYTHKICGWLQGVPNICGWLQGVPKNMKHGLSCDLPKGMKPSFFQHNLSMTKYNDVYQIS